MKNFKKKLIYLISSFLVIISTASAVTITQGGAIDSHLRTKTKSTKAGENIIVVYAFGYKANKNTNIKISLNYDDNFLRANLITGVYGEPHAACRLVSAKEIECNNVEKNMAHNINVVFKIMKDFDSDKDIKASAQSVDKNIQFTQGTTLTRISKKDEVVKDFIRFLNESLDLNAGDEFPLAYEVSEKYGDKKLTFSTNNPAVIAVDQKGMIKAIGPGTANVIVTSEDGQKKEMQVNVLEAKEEECLVKDIDIQKEFKINPLEVRSFSFKADNPCARVQDFQYKVDNTKVLWVDANGYLIGLNPGETKVSVSYNGKTLKEVDVKVGEAKKKKKSSGGIIFFIIVLIIIGVVVYFFILKKPKNKVEVYEDTPDDDVKDDNKEVDDEEYFDGIDLDV